MSKPPPLDIVDDRYSAEQLIQALRIHEHGVPVELPALLDLLLERIKAIETRMSEPPVKLGRRP